MKIVGPGDPSYNTDRQISNARFDLYPKWIYYCTNEEEVGKALQAARDQHLPVRIRSGGHQHEGMCSGDGVLMIDVTGIHGIDFAPNDPSLVRIGAGARLKDIYAALWQKGFMFSGGGCPDVHVGGLAQGGGWGPVCRQYGLTCDTMVGAEIVTAEKGFITTTTEAVGPISQLLWALRGGGGGNFGVVTRYYFRVSNPHRSYTDFVYSWRDRDFTTSYPNMEEFIAHWIATFPGPSDRRLTTFLRLSVVKDDSGDRVVIGGRYLGVEADTRRVLGELLRGQAPPYNQSFSPSMDPITFAEMSPEKNAAEWDAVGRRLASLPGYQPGPGLVEDHGVEAAPGAPPPPNVSDTCAGVPLRHKISSGFPTGKFDIGAIRLATRKVRESPYHDNARQYLSFHSLGGAVDDEPSPPNAYAFRDRQFLLQYQAWWMPKDSGLDPTCIQWIEDFRTKMTNASYTNGAFINFVDRDIPVADYYGTNFKTLRDVKTYWDPKYFFRFGLSIPPAGVDA